MDDQKLTYKQTSETWNSPRHTLHIGLPKTHLDQMGVILAKKDFDPDLTGGE
jgi:hypothetical protein